MRRILALSSLLVVVVALLITGGSFGYCRAVPSFDTCRSIPTCSAVHFQHASPGDGPAWACRSRWGS